MHTLRHPLGPALLSALLVLLWASATALAQTGVSDDRVSLPSGPGSLEGIGENVEPNPNMGTMQLSVPIEVPEGFAGMTPGLSLSYSSGGGGSEVGMGWTLALPSIERTTFKGLPRYDRDDRFAADGGDELVRIPGTDPPVYRSRYEGAFVRYTWMADDAGAAGYWVAEQPDGSKVYYGADKDGTLDPNARVTGPHGTFKYKVVEMTDVYGHAVKYRWRKSPGRVIEGEEPPPVVSLIDEITWVFTQGAPTYRVAFTFEPRMDATGAVEYLSDAGGGFEELLTERLARIDVFSRGERIRAYELRYEPYADSGGFTRLSKVVTLGQRGGEYPIAQTFSYSKALGGVCDGTECQRPYMVAMGSLGVDLKAGKATLVDLNGDALPDVVDTSQNGPHQVFLNMLTADGQTFGSGTNSAWGTRDGHELGTAATQVIDVNGDGLTDLINVRTGLVLPCDASGDWAEPFSLFTGDGGLPPFELDDDGDLGAIRFVDYDNDKRIDVLRSTDDTTSVFRNSETGAFVLDETAAPIGVSFESERLELQDMNGDGLLDPVQLLTGGELRYRLNLGFGQWSAWIVITDLPFDESDIAAGYVELEDMNGDGLSDLVVVIADEVRYAINRNAAAFDSAVTLTSASVNGELPQRDDTYSVLFADMNGNGSSDIVWADSEGNVDYLELFPVRPNLLSRIENGIGKVTDIAYGTSVAQLVLDGGPGAWSSPLPHPMQVVVERDEYDLLTDLHEVTAYRYHDGFYDGDEKQFRGFARVEMTLVGDDTQEPGLTDMYYDVGKSDPLFNGKLLRQVQFSGDRELSDTVTTWQDCPVAEVAGTTGNPVRYICQTGTTTVTKEGLAEDRWVTTAQTSTWDGYGNVTLSVDYGVTEVGGGSCAPCDGRDPEVFGAACGPECVGDELYTEADYIPPGASTSGRWILHAASEERTWGRPGSDLMRVERTYYDGPEFVGLALGQLDQGKVTRMTAKKEVGSDDVIQAARSRFDVHGNVVESIDPNGEPGAHRNRRQYTYEEDGLRVIQADVLLEDPDGAPFVLRRTLSYEPLFDHVSEGSSWLRVVNGEPVSTARSARYGYDEFGRMSWRVLPGGDTPAAPTEAFSYELGSPTSRIVTRKRSMRGQPFDLESIQCLDGRGRLVQSRTRLEEGRYQVTGFTLFNVRSQPVRIYQPFLADSAQCDPAPPSDVLFSQYTYDATYRQTTMTAPDSSLYGAASVTRMLYAPLTTIELDAEDADPTSPHANTPTVTFTNGLGHTVAIDRALTPTESARIAVTWDSLGRLRGTVDPGGNEKLQEYDLLDRVTRILDPNTRGETVQTWDDAGNLVAVTDDRGVTTRTAWDGMNRRVATWDDADPDATRITWRYDADPACPDCTHGEGRAVTVTWPGPDGQPATDHLGYDLRERAVFNARTLAGATYTFTTAFDNVDRITAITYPDGSVIEQLYDDASRITAIPGVIEAATYDARSQLTAFRHGDGTRTAMTFDALMRPASTTVRGTVGELQGWRYTRDRVGNLTTVEDLVDLAPAFGQTWTYDAWYRVTGAELGVGDATAEQVSLTFDDLDNLLARTSSRASSRENVGAYTYADAPNAVTAVGSRAYRYDDAGHMTDRDGVALTWDFMGRMTTAGTTTFAYGANPSRVARTEGDSTVLYASPTFEVRDGITTLYVKFDGHRVARVESDVLAAELMGDPVPDGQVNAADAATADDPRLLWTSVRRLLLETGPPDGTTFLHHDHLGNLTLATAADGASNVPLGERAFTSTGRERPDAWGYVDDYGFTGQELDRSTGLLHFDFRYYDPVTARWLSVDPAFATATADNVTRLGESTTAYNYVAGNLANATDPTGLAVGANLKGKVQSGLKTLNAARKATVKNVKRLKAPAREVTRLTAAVLKAAVRDFTTTSDTRILGSNIASRTLVRALAGANISRYKKLKASHSALVAHRSMVQRANQDVVPAALPPEDFAPVGLTTAAPLEPVEPTTSEPSRRPSILDDLDI